MKYLVIILNVQCNGGELHKTHFNFQEFELEAQSLELFFDAFSTVYNEMLYKHNS